MTISQKSIDEVRQVSEANAEYERRETVERALSDYLDSLTLLKSKALEIAFLLSATPRDLVPGRTRDKVEEFKTLDTLTDAMYARYKEALK